MEKSYLDFWLEAAHRHRDEVKEMPIVIGVEIYHYFGNHAKIVDVNVYRGGTEVTLEGTFGELATVDSDELELRPVRKTLSN